QAGLPRHRGGAHRPDDRGQAGPRARRARGRRRDALDRDEQRGADVTGEPRPQARDRRGRVMAFYGFDGYFRPYVSVAERKAHGARELARLWKKARRAAEPVVITAGRRHVATTFWGKAWCENLERYADFANRLPRGRTYIRNGSVLDLAIAKGK